MNLYADAVRPKSFAARSTPLPAIGSSTTSPGFVHVRMWSFANANGNIAG